MAAGEPVSADIQRWIDDPSPNFGWILLGGGEGGPGTSRQFASSKNLTANYVPTLTLVTAPIPEPSSGLLLLAGVGVLLVIARLKAARTRARQGIA